MRIYKQGEQQRYQNEISDGVIIVFETVPLNGQSLRTVVKIGLSLVPILIGKVRHR